VTVRTVDNDRLIRAALSYASRGWRVHPLRPGTKVPVLADWTRRATTDPEVILGWWTGDYHGHNLGIATGRDSGLFVLDVDTAGGKVGAESLAALEAAHKPLKPTYTVRTPSGGTHYYYAWPEEVPGPDGSLPTWRNVASGVLGKDLDIRAEGGQVAAWPSIMADGSSYKRLTRNDPVRLPRWLAKRTVYREPVDLPGFQVVRSELNVAALERATRYGQSAVDSILDELDDLAAAAVPEGETYTGLPWNTTVFQKSCRLVELANADWSPLSVDDARQLVVDHAPQDRGFTRATVLETFRSAAQTVGGRAATLPPTIVGPFELPGPARSAPAGLPPDAYFEKDGVQVARAAAAVDEGDIAIGADGLFWRYEAGVWHPDRDVVRHRLAVLLADKYRSSLVPSVEDMIRARGVPRITDAPHLELLNTRSGMVDWASGRVLPHDPAYLSTVQLPVEWDEEAVCPRFDRWMGEVIDPPLTRRLWEVIGYMLAQGNTLQRAILLIGTGGNGKGTLIRVLKRLIGAHNTAAVTLVQMAEGRFEVAELYGKQANLAGDIEARYLRETAMFKALTGQDTVLAQRKRQDPFHFVCHATPLFSANEVPKSIDNSEGYHRRWVVMPMDRKVEGTRRKFDEDDLFAELPGILRKAVAHLGPLMAARGFDEPIEARMAQERFAEASDTVATWLREDEAVVLADPDADVRGGLWREQTHIYARFRRWAAESGHQALSSTRFYDRLQALGYVRRGRNGRQGFFGLRLASNAEGYLPLASVLPPE
jgi:putative DNA primase/helicase